MFSASCEFAAQRRGQVLEHGLHVDNLIQTRALPDFLCKHLEQSEVLLDRLACRRPLYLDDNPVAARQRRALDLGNGAGGKGFGIYRIEHVLPRHSEFLLHDLDDLFLGHRSDVVLQRRELLDVLGRQKVRARRQYLPELRIGRAEFLERSSQPPWRRPIAQLGPPFRIDRFLPSRAAPWWPRGRLWVERSWVYRRFGSWRSSSRPETLLSNRRPWAS
jgi:hypothetical protein